MSMDLRADQRRRLRRLQVSPSRALEPSLRTYWIMARNSEKLCEYFSLCIIQRDKLVFRGKMTERRKNRKMCQRDVSLSSLRKDVI